MNLSRIYEYRFTDIEPARKQLVWKTLSNWFFNGYLNKPDRILDPAAGCCEFINSIPAGEKWAIDLTGEMLNKHASTKIHHIVGSCLEVDLPENYFDAIFISNFLEHLENQEEVNVMLSRMYKACRKNGRVVIMGPNYKYCFREYFDFADHKVILSDTGVCEHLHGAGFSLVRSIPRFLPLSFRSRSWVPVNKFIISAYLKFPALWKFFGKQFLIVAVK